MSSPVSILEPLRKRKRAARWTRMNGIHSLFQGYPVAHRTATTLSELAVEAGMDDTWVVELANIIKADMMALEREVWVSATEQAQWRARISNNGS